MSPAFVDNDGQLNWRKIGYHARSAFAVILSLAVLLGGGWFVADKIHDAYVGWRTEDDFIGEGKDPVVVTVPPGATITQIGDILVEHNVVKSTKTFREEAAKNAKAATLQAGRYTLKAELPAAKALEMMLDPKNQKIIKITLPEGLTLGQQWTLIERKLKMPRAQLQKAADIAQFDLPPWSGGKPEGFMFPDTYQVGEPLDPLALYKTQVKLFKTVATDLNLEGRAQVLGVRPLDIVIVASIIEREAARPEDRANIASVIYNRLKINKPLQLDSTVHYAVGAVGRVTTTAQDRAVQSPYNTYLKAGLPPGAISNPGKAALKAAAHPAVTNFLFFTAVDLDSGETLFAADDEAHMSNVAKFQAWCQSHQGRCT